MTFYIGKQPTIGNYAKMDSISAVNGQATYNLLKGGVAFAPQSANHVICSLNSIIQNPGSSFTISGSQITFASNLLTGDSIDFILVLGDTLSIGVPSDDTIDSAKLKTNSVVAAKIQNNAVTTDKINNDAVTTDKINLISTSSAPSLEAKGDGSSVEGKIQLNCHVNSHGVTLQSPPHSSGQSWTLKLPDNSPTANKFMKVKSITGSGSTAVGQLEFAEAGGGSWEKLGETNVTTGTASVTFDGLFTSTYPNYRFIATDIVFASQVGALFRVMVGGSEQTGSNYYSGHNNVQASSGGAGADASRSWANSSFELNNHSLSDATREVSHLVIDIFNPLYASSNPTFMSQHVINKQQSSSIILGVGGYFYYTETAISGIKFFPASGNINYGNFYLYGIKN